MATMGPNAISSGTPAASSGTPAAATTSPAAPAEESSGSFMSLVMGKIQGTTPGEQLPSNLAAVLPASDAGVLEGIATDTDGDVDTDDDNGDEDAIAELSALSALLAGLQPFQPVAPADSAGSDSTGISSVTTEGSREGELQDLLSASQATVAATLDGAAGAAEMSADGTAGASADGTMDATNGVNGMNGAGPPGASNNSASHVQSMMQAHRAAEAAPQAASSEVRTPVGAQGWSDELGTHLSIMAANGREAASLRLSPEHLGPLEIRISMKDGEASVMFNASNADTRSALEQSLPRLREMFASQGLVLGDANVSRDAPRDSFKPATFARAGRGSSDSGSVTDVKPITLSRLGLVDTYV